MKKNAPLASVLLASALLAAPAAGFGADKAKDKQDARPKPYPLKVCLVEDDDLGNDPHVFVYQGQEIKLCCEGCKDDFDKNPKKYLKKLEKPEKKAK